MPRHLEMIRAAGTKAESVERNLYACIRWNGRTLASWRLYARPRVQRSLVRIAGHTRSAEIRYMIYPGPKEISSSRKGSTTKIRCPTAELSIRARAVR
jgi:hypothetical protein